MIAKWYDAFVELYLDSDLMLRIESHGKQHYITFNGKTLHPITKRMYKKLVKQGVDEVKHD